ncbi:MAG: tyrosine-type recombinase/integrase [Bryobacterales bacterium]|nr:tyrosine-type recombinase/integrase [Bryobacterales bacterium]
MLFIPGWIGKEKSMIESLFKQTSTLARLQSGPLARELPILAEALHEQQYPPETIRRYVRVADQFGRWLCRHRLSLIEADEATVARYRSSIARRKNGALRAAARGLSKVLKLLRRQDDRDEPARAAHSECEELVRSFDSHLRHVAGLMPGTRVQYLCHVNRFVKTVFAAGTFEIANVTPQVISDFVREQAAKLKPSFCAAPATSMRVFLRFLVAHHGLPAGMTGAVPTIRQWKLASLPRHLSMEQVDQTLATCEENSAVGLRDRAILLLLARLALRAGEVARLRLSDIDWREGELKIHPPKSARERKLPLPNDVGQALAEYVQSSRPQSTEPFLFLRTRAPFSPITGPSTVSGIAKRHLKLAGISTRGLSAHAFRHTAATQMVRRGVGFKQVADVLGHRLLETTNIYAKLDEVALHRVALPWPGGEA